MTIWAGSKDKDKGMELENGRQAEVQDPAAD